MDELPTADLPDLLILVRRDGAVVGHAGGHAMAELHRPASDEAAASLHLEPAAENLIRQLARKAITSRTFVDSRFNQRSQEYEIRVWPRGPDRALCIIRAPADPGRPGANDATVEQMTPGLDRRGFMRRLRESLAM